MEGVSWLYTTQNQIADVEIVHCSVEIVGSTVEVITQVRGEEEGGEPSQKPYAGRVAVNLIIFTIRKLGAPILLVFAKFPVPSYNGLIAHITVSSSGQASVPQKEK